MDGRSTGDPVRRAPAPRDRPAGSRAVSGPAALRRLWVTREGGGVMALPGTETPPQSEGPARQLRRRGRQENGPADLT